MAACRSRARGAASDDAPPAGPERADNRRACRSCRWRASRRARRLSMLVLPGAPAFSSGRLEKKLAALRAKNPAVSSVTADHVHFVDAGELSADQRRVLDSLLTYGPRRKSPAVEGTRVIVIPRLGTISPWS